MTKLAEKVRHDGLPFTMRLARLSPVELAEIANDPPRYDPRAQMTVYSGGTDPLTMGRSTCSRSQSTGLIFTDHDRMQDD
jgi:hypothetical protein